MTMAMMLTMTTFEILYWNANEDAHICTERANDDDDYDYNAEADADDADDNVNDAYHNVSDLLLERERGRAERRTDRDRTRKTDFVLYILDDDHDDDDKDNDDVYHDDDDVSDLPLERERGRPQRGAG